VATVIIEGDRQSEEEGGKGTFELGEWVKVCQWFSIRGVHCITCFFVTKFT